MIRSVAQIAATPVKVIVLLGVFWMICNGFVLLDFMMGQ